MITAISSTSERRIKKALCWQRLTTAALALTVVCAALPCLGAQRILISTNPVVIGINVSPTAGTLAYAVEEQLPNDTAATAISDGGTFDRFTHKVKWGPFLDDQARTLSYQLVAIAAGDVTLAGTVNTNGTSDSIIQGIGSVSASGSGFQSWLLQEFGAVVFTRPESDTSNDSDGDKIPMAIEYYFNLDPKQVDTDPIQVQMEPDSKNFDLKFVRRTNTTGFSVQLLQTSDFVGWNAVNGDPDRPILHDLGDGTEQVTYQIPADQPAKFFSVEIAYPQTDVF